MINPTENGEVLSTDTEVTETINDHLNNVA